RRGERDGTPCVVELDDTCRIHLRQVELLEGGVDALSLGRAEIDPRDVVLPRGDLFGEIADVRRSLVLFERVQRVPPTVVAQYVEQVVVRNARSSASPSIVIGRCRFNSRLLRSRLVRKRRVARTRPHVIPLGWAHYQGT